jgi:hypothetical protein
MRARARSQGARPKPCRSPGRWQALRGRHPRYARADVGSWAQAQRRVGALPHATLSQLGVARGIATRCRVGSIGPRAGLVPLCQRFVRRCQRPAMRPERAAATPESLNNRTALSPLRRLLFLTLTASGLSSSLPLCAPYPCATIMWRGRSAVQPARRSLTLP